jgi:hypothetical protein
MLPIRGTPPEVPQPNTVTRTSPHLQMKVTLRQHGVNHISVFLMDEANYGKSHKMIFRAVFC